MLLSLAGPGNGGPDESKDEAGSGAVGLGMDVTVGYGAPVTVAVNIVGRNPSHCLPC